jgi:hypothetical protein
MKARKKRVVMKPIIAMELLVIVLLAGVGVAYAFTVNPITTGTDPWAGEATISESDDLSVTSYKLGYTANLTHVSGVTVEVTNSDTAAHSADINVAILDSSNVLKGSGAETGQTIPLSAAVNVTVTLDSAVVLGDVDELKIIVTDNG